MSQDQPIVLDPTYASFDAAARPADLGATHFIGIGGAGMSVLAEMLHAEGVAVDGSDRAHSARTDRLETLGITVEFGQRAEKCRPGRDRGLLQRHSNRTIRKSSQHTRRASALCIAVTSSPCS